MKSWGYGATLISVVGFFAMPPIFGGDGKIPKIVPKI